MVRVVAPGGTVAAYPWDLEGGGFPYQCVNDTLRAVGRAIPTPPSPESSRLEALRDLWVTAGLGDIRTRVITVERTYTDSDDLWSTVRRGPSAGQGPGGHGRAGRLPIRKRSGVGTARGELHPC